LKCFAAGFAAVDLRRCLYGIGLSKNNLRAINFSYEGLSQVFTGRPKQNSIVRINCHSLDESKSPPHTFSVHGWAFIAKPQLFE